MNETPDTLVVYGAGCIWWDTIDKAGKTPAGANGHSLPCCPHCGSVLFEMPWAQWWDGVDRWEAAGNAGYRTFVEWWRGQCFKNLADATAAYERRNDKHEGEQP